MTLTGKRAYSPIYLPSSILDNSKLEITTLFARLTILVWIMDHANPMKNNNIIIAITAFFHS